MKTWKSWFSESDGSEQKAKKRSTGRDRSGDLRLWKGIQSEIDMSSEKKLAYKWIGPYRIRTAIPEKGTYILEEFDGTLLPGTFAGNRLKKFVKREGIYEPEMLAGRSEEGEEEEEE